MVLKCAIAELIVIIKSMTLSLSLSFTPIMNQLTNGDKYTIDEMVGSVVINNALEVDSGAYVCTAENSIDGEDHEATGSATLTVLGERCFFILIFGFFLFFI